MQGYRNGVTDGRTALVNADSPKEAIRTLGLSGMLFSLSWYGNHNTRIVKEIFVYRPDVISQKGFKVNTAKWADCVICRVGL